MSKVSVDFSAALGKVKPMHGVNNGPKTTGFFRDTSRWFREAGFPYARLHDTEYPFGSGAFVDIPCIFKDFNADPDDPASYDFSQTDLYLKAICDTGCKPFYRLGVSIEHTPVRRNVYAPADPVQWARICAGIVRHYNEGWADGFHMDIEYWEIWNEPEGEGTWRTNMWIGTNEQFYELYATAAAILKKEFPNIRVGGFGSCGFYYLTRGDKGYYGKFMEFAEDFFKYIREKNAPLDFFSWHLYTKDPSEVEVHARHARALMDKYGYTRAESILDEWNWAGDGYDWMETEQGAALNAAMEITMQRESVDVATYYDAQPVIPYCGIFRLTDLTPTKAYYSLSYWNRLYTLRTACAASAEGENIYAYAACNGAKAAVLISNYNGEDKLTLDLSHVPQGTLALRVTDSQRTNETLFTLAAGKNITLNLDIEPFSVLLLETV